MKKKLAITSFSAPRPLWRAGRFREQFAEAQLFVSHPAMRLAAAEAAASCQRTAPMAASTSLRCSSAASPSFLAARSSRRFGSPSPRDLGLYRSLANGSLQYSYARGIFRTNALQETAAMVTESSVAAIMATTATTTVASVVDIASFSFSSSAVSAYSSNAVFELASAMFKIPCAH